MMNKPFDARQKPPPPNAANDLQMSNSMQRVAFSYPPQQDLNYGFMPPGPQQQDHIPSNSQTMAQNAYPSHQRGTVPGALSPPQQREFVSAPMMQIYNYGTHNFADQQNKLREQQQQHNQQENSQDEDQQAQQREILLFWEHRFFTIFERFQIIHEKVEWMRTQFYNLNNELKAVDSQAEWNTAKEHHDDYMEQIQEFSQELAGVLNENIALYQQQQRENDESGIWRQRYYELFQSYKNLEVQISQLREGAGGAVNNQQEQPQQLNEVIQAYRQLEREYTNVMNELNELKQSTNDNQQVNNYRQRLDYTLNEAEKYKDILEKLHEQNQEMNNQIIQLRKENENLNRRLSSVNKREDDTNLSYEIQTKNQEINHLSQEIQSIQEQYEKMMHERQENQNYLIGQTQLYEQELSKTVQELEIRTRELENKSREVQHKNRELENKSREVQHKNRELESRSRDFESRSRDLEQKNKKIRELDVVKFSVQELEMKNKSLHSKIQDLERSLRNKHDEINDMNDEIRDKISENRDKAAQIQRLKYTISNLEAKARNFSDRDLIRKEYELKTKNLQTDYETKIISLKKVIKQKEEDSQISALTQIKLQTLEKKNKTLLHQIEKLSIELVDKDKELYDLRRSGYESERVKQFEFQYQMIAEQKQALSQTVLQKNLQLDNLQKKLSEFEDRIRGMNDRSNSNSSKSLILEIEELNNLIHSKESEIIKLKSTINLKQQFIGQLQAQIERANNKQSSREIEYEKEKNILEQRLKDSEKRNYDNDKKLRELEFDYGLEMKKNLEEEIKSLRNQNQSKQETINRMQVNEMELQSRLAHFERIKGTVDSDIEEMASRIREMESSKIQMIKKVETSYRDTKKKDKEIKDYIENQKYLKMTMADLENKFRDTENMANEKQKIIDDLESQLMVINNRFTYLTEEHERLRLRRRDETDVFVRQSDDLKRKLYEIEANPVKQQQEEAYTTVYQRITQLEEEKEFLKSELAVALQKIGNVPYFKSVSEHSVRKSKVSKGSEGIDYIQKRLFEFNSKIDDMIRKNRQLKNINGLNEAELMKSQGRNRPAENEEIKLLKEQIQSLRKYCAKLEVETGGETIRPNPRYSMIFIEQEKAITDKFSFYKKQNQELEERINKLLQINTSLKERIDSLLRGDKRSSVEQYYVEQISQLEETIQNLIKKNQKLGEENRLLRNNNEEANTKTCREYQDQIFEYQTKIFELERKIVNLEIEKSKSQSQRLTLSRDYNANKSTLETTVRKLARNEKQNSQLSKQIHSLENETSEMLSKMRVLQSENSRLTQAVQASFSQQHILLNTPSHRSPIRY